jgi:MarR family transcriptional regulator for hemolysin
MELGGSLLQPTIEERFSAALHNSARSWRQALDRRLKEMGLGKVNWMAIAIIAKASQPLSQTELAHRLVVEDPTVVAMVDRLVKAGFAARVPSQTDRRVKLVVLTPAGNQLYKKIKAVSAAFRAEFLADIAPNKLLAATELLETLRQTAESAI